MSHLVVIAAVAYVVTLLSELSGHFLLGPGTALRLLQLLATRGGGLLRFACRTGCGRVDVQRKGPA